MGTITSRMSRIFHLGHHAQSTHGDANAATGATAADGDAGPSHPRRVSTSSSASSGSSNLFSEPSRPPTPMLDPSTHTNPLKYPDEIGDNGEEDNNNNNNNNTKKNKKKKRTGDVSKHTFYIENSQMRLKLFAHNEVRCRFLFPSLGSESASEMCSSFFVFVFVLSARCCNGLPRSKGSLRVAIIQGTIGSTVLRRFG